MTLIGLPRRLLAELPGTALLVTVVGSGIAAAQLSPEDVGLQVLRTAATLIAGSSPAQSSDENGFD